MIDRRIAVLLVVDAVLLAAIGLSSLRETTPAPIPFRLPALAEIEGMTLTRTGQPAVALRRANGEWTADGAPIDPYAHEALRDVFAGSVGADLAVDVAGADLDDYGLGEHALTVRFTGAGPAEPLRIGRVVDGRRTFVWPVGGAQIYRLRADLGQAFDRPAAQWVDRRLVTFGIKDIAALEMTRGERRDWSARRGAADAPWRFVEPAGLEAGQDEVGGVAATLVTARAESVVSAEGFAPTATLTVETFAGQRVAIGLRPDGDRLLARLPGRARLLRLPRHQAVFLDARVDALRERRVFGPELTPEVVDVVHIEGERPLRLERDRARRWRIVQPAVDEAPSDAAVDQWLAALLGLRAVGFAERAADGTFADARRVMLDHGGERVTLEIGAPFGHQARLARRDDRRARVMVIGASALDVLAPTIERLLAEPADQPPGR